MDASRPPQLPERTSSKEKDSRVRLSRKMIPSAHEKLSKLKDKLGGNSNKPLPEIKPSGNRQASIDSPQNPVSDSLPAGDSVKAVSAISGERSPAMTASLTSSAFHDGYGEVRDGGSGMENDVAKLQIDLNRARLEAAQAQHNQKEAEKALHQHLLDVENGLARLRLQHAQGGQPDQSGRHINSDEMHTQLQNVYGGKDNLETLNAALTVQLENTKYELAKKTEACANLSQQLAEVQQQLQDPSQGQNTKAILEDNRTLKMENSDLKRSLEKLKGEYSEAQSDFNEQESRCDQLQLELENAQREVHRLEKEVAKVQNDSSGAVVESERLRQQVNRLVLQAASATPTLDVYYSDDVYFQKQFGILRGKVKDWANRAFSSYTSKTGRRISVTVLREFDSVSKDWDIYMESDEHRPSFVQAFVWNYLLHRVFGSRFWESSASSQPYGRLLEDYSNTRGNDPEYQRLYHEWRSAGARLAAPIGSEQQVVKTYASARIERVIKNISEPLDAWCTMGTTQANDSLQKILIDAILLDLKMQQQKAFFILLGYKEVWNISDGKYDPARMEVRFGKVSKSKEQFMVLLTAPLLAKRGNSDGQNYNTHVVVEKAQVDIELPKRKRAYVGVS